MLRKAGLPELGAPLPPSFVTHRVTQTRISGVSIPRFLTEMLSRNNCNRPGSKKIAET